MQQHMTQLQEAMSNMKPKMLVNATEQMQSEKNFFSQTQER
jgi:hypothetical protein